MTQQHLSPSFTASTLLLALLLLCGSCQTAEEGEVEAETTAAPTESAAEIPLVSLHTATSGRLPLRRQATGKLRARREVVIKSQTGGLALTAPTEGTYYKEGELLLATDPRPLELARDRAAAAREEAAFRQRDLLLRISINLPPGDSSAITDLARANILIQSGLPAAEVALEEAEYQLSLARLSAPFSGRAADVKVLKGQQLNMGEEVCTLIDPNSLEAEFSLLEQELKTVRAGMEVMINFPNVAGGEVPPLGVRGDGVPPLGVRGLLDILNPRIDAGGLLRARARLRDYGKARLYPGMNVTVTLETMAPAAVLLPKSAVVVRSGRSLVFTYDAASRRAKWQYVTVGYENDEMVGITEGVEPGQQVIVSGGLTLDHDVVVRVEE